MFQQRQAPIANQDVHILCGKQRRVGMEVVINKITNAPELLSRLQEVGRCMELSSPSAADDVRTACRALAHTTQADSPEVAAAGLDLATAAEGVSDSAAPSLRLHLSLQTLDRKSTRLNSSHLGISY